MANWLGSYTDHKPLVPLINSKDLDVVPMRCQRLLIRLMHFNCEAEYTPGKTLTVPDTLSRSPLAIEEVDICEVDDYINYVPVSDAMVCVNYNKLPYETVRCRQPYSTPSVSGLSITRMSHRNSDRSLTNVPTSQ